MDVLYRQGSATADEVRRGMDDPPTTTTVRGLLRILETKGHVSHDVDGARYVYRPVLSRDDAAAHVLPHVVRTFFGGSPSRAMAALLGSGGAAVDEKEIERLSRVIEDARRRRS